MTRCGTTDELVATFARFSRGDTLFIVTDSPRAVGPAQPFIIQLKDGSVAMEGRAEIVESHREPTGPGNRRGMRLRFVELSPASRALLAQMNALQEGRRGAVPPPVPPGRVTMMVPVVPPPTRAESVPVAEEVSTSVDAVPPALRYELRDLVAEEKAKQAKQAAALAAAEAEISARSAAAAAAEEPPAGRAPTSPPQEERAPGSPYMLPANPFAELNDEALEYFVECTIYEDTGVFSLSDPAFAAPDGDRAAPLPLPSLEPPREAPARSIIAPLPLLAPPIEAPLVAKPSPTPTPTPFAAPAIDPILAPLHPPARKAPLIITGLAASVIGIGGGYLLWGRGGPPAASTPPATPAGAAAVAPPTPTPTPTPAPADVPTPPAVAAAVAPDPPVSDSSDKAGGGEASTSTSTSAGAGGACRVTVTTDPPEVKVLWDGHSIGVTPLDAAEVPCGTASLTLEHPRYELVQRRVTAAADAPASLEVKMARPVGRLSLKSSPPGAVFTVNGSSAGKGPTSTEVNAFTTVTVKASLTGYKPWSQRIYLRGRESSVTATLEKASKTPTRPR